MKVKIFIPYIFVVFVSLYAIVPLFRSGFFNMHDDTQVARVYGMTKSIQDGLFPVRWVADLGYGYGYPIFNFYAPLPYYTGSLFNLIGFDSLISTKIMFSVGILLSGVTMYLFSSRILGKGAAVVSAIFYMYFPYHALNIYVRGAVGEFFAYAFLPLIFLGLFELYLLSSKVVGNDKLFWVIFTSISIFLTLVSHNITAIMLFVLLIPFAAISILLSKHKLNLIKLFSVSILLGGLLSSFFILPAFMEMKNTNVSSQIGGGADYKDHFVCFPQLLSSNWGYGGSIPGCVDGISYSLGKLNILLLIVSVLSLCFGIYKKHLDSQLLKIVFITILMVVISVFLLLNISNTFWNLIPLMGFIQYPWRFLNFVGLFAAILIGLPLYLISKLNSKFLLPLVGAYVFMILLLNTKYFVPQSILNVDSNFYTSNEKLHFETSKISDEYLPKGFIKPKTNEELILNDASFEGGNYEITENSTGKLILKIENYTDNNPLIIYRTHNPAWEAVFNNKKIAVLKFDNSFSVINLPKGSGELVFELKQTPIQVIGNTLTLVSIIMTLLVIMVKSLKRKVIKFLT